MKKVLNINLGGYPFTIDEDAYATLDNYLQTINRHFSYSEGHEEIVGDIETRMAELFQENLSGGSQIVSLKEVQKGIATMGKPEDFGAEPIENTAHSKHQTATKSKSNYKTGKRLYRDVNDEVIGGVASGMTAYFGFQDPLWMRIALVVSVIIGFGFPVIAYIILWVILPKAETAADRLAMRGETVNATNIGRVVEEELDKFGNKVEKWGDEVNAKYASSKKKASKVAKGRAVGYAAPLRKGFIF